MGCNFFILFIGPNVLNIIVYITIYYRTIENRIYIVYSLCIEPYIFSVRVLQIPAVSSMKQKGDITDTACPTIRLDILCRRYFITAYTITYLNISYTNGVPVCKGCILYNHMIGPRSMKQKGNTTDAARPTNDDYTCFADGSEIFRIGYCIRGYCTSDKYFLFK